MSKERSSTGRSFQADGPTTEKDLRCIIAKRARGTKSSPLYYIYYYGKLLLLFCFSRYLASSKFQPTDARKAFPCLDEPGFKTTFNVTLIHRPNYTALSNMPQEARLSHTHTNYHHNHHRRRSHRRQCI